MFRFTIRDVLWLTMVVALEFSAVVHSSSDRGRADLQDGMTGPPG